VDFIRFLARWVVAVDPRTVAVRRECPVDIAAVPPCPPASAVEPHGVRAGVPSDLDVVPSWKTRRHSGLVGAHYGWWHSDGDATTSAPEH
jgi:hypothetical protein